MQNILLLIVVVVVITSAVVLIVFEQSAAAALGTPTISAKAKFILNPSFPASFYYSTDDDVMILDTLEITNLDRDRDVTVELVGQTEGQEGWFSFSDTTLTVAKETIFTPEEVTMMITIPDNVCDGEYEGKVLVNITDYEGKTTGEFAVTSTIAVDVIFDINSGYAGPECVGDPVLPGLGAAPSFIPPETAVAEVLEEAPVVVPGGGGGGLIILPPITPPEEPPPEESVTAEESITQDLITVNLRAYPEKRLPPTGNWSTDGRVKIYNEDSGELLSESVVRTDNQGLGSFEVDLPPGRYDVSFKGLSHLTKFLRLIDFDILEPVDLDFTFGTTFRLLAGDVHLSKDDVVNSLDFAATAEAIYTNNVHADLNKDGLVNGLDFSIEAINVNQRGESAIPLVSFGEQIINLQQ